MKARKQTFNRDNITRIFLERNLLDIIRADGVQLKKFGTTYRGRCPFHNGKTETSLLVDADAGKYHCFGCDFHGDAIQWLRERRGLSYIEACQELGKEPGERKSPRPREEWTPKEATAPGELWQARAKQFLADAVKCLWSDQGEPVRQWLHDKKGLNDATIKEACLGVNFADKYEPRATWGLDPVIKEDGTEKKQWIPAGLIIPWVVNGAVQRLRIRRNDPGDGQRYVIVSGSETVPMAWVKDQGAVVVVESELDGLLLNQEAGDLAGVVALGTVKAKPDEAIHMALLETAVILISLDTDAPGIKASWRFWPDTYGTKARRWPTVKGKDASEARLNGLDLRAWVIAGLFGNEERFERFAIQTIDGGLSDREAIEII